MSTLRIDETISYTPPGGTAISSATGMNVSYTAQADGSIDIPAGTSALTEYSLGLGSIALPKAVEIWNKSGQTLGVEMQGDAAGKFDLTTGGNMRLSMSTAPTTGGAPITAVKLVTSQLSVAAGTVDYLVFGDS